MQVLVTQELFRKMAHASADSEVHWCVYNMRMSRINVYLPDELAEEAKKAGLNISSLTQEAIRSSLAARNLERWQQQVSELASPGVSHAAVLEAVTAAKDDLENG